MYRTILVAIDGSPRAGKALKAAVRMARGSGARLHVLNVQPTFISVVAPAPAAAVQMNRGVYEAAVGSASARILRSAERFARRQGVKCRTLSVLAGSVPQAIVRAAKRVRADLIVMASHGRGGLGSLLLGSNTQKVLAACRIPVLIHR
jgi:nucleotide-binding universal stress UspA family protein